MSDFRVNGQVYGNRASTVSGTQSASGLGGFFEQFLPPSPTDIMNKVLIGVAVVTGAILIIGVVYLVTRKGKGAR